MQKNIWRIQCFANRTLAGYFFPFILLHFSQADKVFFFSRVLLLVRMATLVMRTRRRQNVW